MYIYIYIFFVYIILFYVSKKTMYGANVIIFEGIFTFYNVDVLKVSRPTVRKAE